MTEKSEHTILFFILKKTPLEIPQKLGTRSLHPLFDLFMSKKPIKSSNKGWGEGGP